MAHFKDWIPSARGWATAGVTVLLTATMACSPAEEPAPSEPEPEARAAAEPEAPLPEWQERIDELEPQVRAWAEDWSNQDVEGYLSRYSPDFQTPGGMPREAWEAQRRDRLTRPSEIEVTLSGLQRTGFNAGFTAGKQRELVSVRFRQAYRSNTYSDEVEKELELELVDGTWRIFRETSL